MTKTIAVTKPPYPIWYLNQKEIETFFSNFKSELAKEEGVRLRPKWPKIVDNVAVKLPTAIPSFDEVVEKILPSSVYVPFQKFPPGNLLWRLKLVLAYILQNKGFDPNVFATEIPEDYEPHVFDLEYLKEMGKDVEASLTEYRRRKQKKITERVVEIDDNRDSEDEEEEDDPETFPESVDPSPGPSAETMAPSSILRKSVIIQTKEPSDELVDTSHITVIQEPSDDLFNTSHGTGTPAGSEVDDEDSTEDVFTPIVTDTEEEIFMAQFEEEMGVINPNPTLPQAPTLVTKKPTVKNVPTRASSQRIKNKKKCNSC